MTIRNANLEDFPSLKRMLCDNLAENGEGSFLAPVSDIDLLADVEAGGVVVAEDAQGVVCGMGCVRVDATRWYVYAVYADPRVRGNGLGGQIVARLHEIAKSNGATKGFVVGNGFIERLFSHAGYKAVGTLMEMA